MEKAMILQEKHNKQSIKTFVRSDFIYPGVKLLYCTSFLMSLIYVLSILTVVVFLQLNQSRLSMQEMYYNIHRGLFKVQLQYSSGLLLSTTGNLVPLSGEMASSNTYDKAIDDFVNFIGSNTFHLPVYFGSEYSTLIETLFYGDVCSLGNYYQFSSSYRIDPEKFCSSLEPLFTQKGLIGYLHQLRLFLSDSKTVLQQNYSNFLETSKTRYIEGPRGHYFSEQFINMRISNRVIFRIAYEMLTSTSAKRVVAVSESLIFYAGELILFPTIAVFLLFSLFLSWTFRQINLDIRYCYEVFSLIDPYYLLNNRYLQNRLKASFAGISS